MKLSLIGFPEAHEVKLQKILQLSKTHTYTLQDFADDTLPDLLLVYGEAMSQQPVLQALSAQHPSRIVVVDKNKPSDAEYHHLPFPLIASRVLQGLEHIAGLMSGNAANTATVKTYIPPCEDLTAARSLAAERTAPKAENAYRVLVVDDSEVMQKSLELELRKLPSPVHIDFAGSGEEALAYTSNNVYSFIFLDVMMPGMDGFETCTQMRKQPGLKKLPIIMLTSKTSPLDEVKGVMAGCTTYLTKPIVSVEFQKVVQRISKWVDHFGCH